jgi:uridine kinase
MSELLLTNTNNTTNTVMDCRIIPLFVGVGGGSASGKTTICKRIQNDLVNTGITCVTLSADNWYHNYNTNYDCPEAYNWAELNNCILDIKSKAKNPKDYPNLITHPIYDYRTHCRTKDTQDIPEVMCYFIEGILVLHNEDVLNQLDVKIFVDSESDNRLIRRIRRDLKERSRDVNSILDQHETMVQPGYNNYIHPTRLNADFIIPNNKNKLNEVVIDFVGKGIKSHFTI